MTIKQLKEAIKDLPDHMDVVIHQTIDDFSYSQVESGQIKKVGFSEEPGGKVLAKDKCFILTDEI